MLKKHAILDGKAPHLTINISWISYAAITMGRYVFPATMATLISQQLFSETQMATVSATFMLLYGLGQFISGLIADRCNPSKLVLLSLSVSGIANLLIPFADGFDTFYIFWSVNALFQSLAWPALARLFSDVLSARDYTRACVSMSSASIFGTMIIYGFSSLITHLAGWQLSFLLSGSVLLLLSLLWLFFIKESKLFESKNTTQHMHCLSDMPKKVKHSLPNHSISLPVLALIAIGCFLHGALKDGIFTWIPVYMSQTASISPATSSMLTMVVPAISLLGVHLIKWLYEKYCFNELMLCGYAFTCAFIAILILKFANGSLIPSLLLLACVSSVMAGINTIYLVLIPNHFRKIGKVSTMTGLLNALTYLGSSIGSFSYGSLSQSYGWGMLPFLWASLAAAGFLFCFLGCYHWRRLI